MASASSVRKLNKSLAKRWNRWVFHLGDPANRKILWDDVCKTQALADATACLRALLPPDVEVTEPLVRRHVDELAGSELLQRSLNRYQDVIEPHVQPTLVNVVRAENLFCYVATRMVKPSAVVETGCATGWSNALLLLALDQNQAGHLYSIDIPPVAGQFGMTWTLPEPLAVGFYVPDELRSRWTLILGNARTELIPLLERIRSVDVFHHDSDHSYPHMMWEYTSVWPYLSEHRLMISDDIGWNTAFWDFATAVGRPIIVHRSNTNFGALARS